ncbi:MAG: hypothetical protein ABW168_11665, partial [Sedimenticola sp.]
ESPPLPEVAPHIVVINPLYPKIQPDSDAVGNSSMTRRWAGSSTAVQKTQVLLYLYWDACASDVSMPGYWGGFALLYRQGAGKEALCDR